MNKVIITLQNGRELMAGAPTKLLLRLLAYYVRDYNGFSVNGARDIKIEDIVSIEVRRA